MKNIKVGTLVWKGSQSNFCNRRAKVRRLVQPMIPIGWTMTIPSRSKMKGIIWWISLERKINDTCVILSWYPYTNDFKGTLDFRVSLISHNKKQEENYDPSLCLSKVFLEKETIFDLVNQVFFHLAEDELERLMISARLNGKCESPETQQASST